MACSTGALLVIVTWNVWLVVAMPSLTVAENILLFLLPTIVYILVIGGALNAVFIPQLVRRMKEDDDDGKAYADRLLTLVASSLLVLSIAAVALAPWIVDLYTPDNYPQSQFDLAVAFVMVKFLGANAVRTQDEQRKGADR